MKSVIAFSCGMLCLIGAGIFGDNGFHGTMMALIAGWFILMVVAGVLSGERA